MRILVTGGSGFIGRAISRRLLVEGHSVSIASRREPATMIPGVHYLGSLNDLAAHPGRARGFEAMIHLVGIIAECGHQTFESVHIGGTRSALGVASAAGIPRFLHMSALGTRADARARYHRTKWEAEELVRGSGLNWTIFRPSIVFGAEDSFVNFFASMIRTLPLVPVIGPGRNLFQPIAVEDVALCFAAALSGTGAGGGTFDLCGSEAVSFRELLGTIMRTMEMRRRLIFIPFPLARLMASVLDLAFPRILRRPAPLTRDQIMMLEEDNTGNPLPAMKAFQFEPKPFGEGIRSFVR